MAPRDCLLKAYGTMTKTVFHTDGLVEDYSNSSMLAMGLLQS